MSATVTPTGRLSTAWADLGKDRWMSLPASWKTYLRLLRDRGEKSRPKYIYVKGRLTAVSPGVPHEIYKSRLGGLIEDILVGLMIPHRMTGSVTLLKTIKPKRAGTEADETYFLTNIDRIGGQKNLLMGRDPAPDLTVEVVVSHPEGEALRAYREFGVREVWVVKRSGLKFLVLGADRTYAPSPTSAVLPFLASSELEPWLFRQDVNDAQLRHEFRAWVAGALAPRLRAEG